jgi:hypothetical protein
VNITPGGKTGWQGTGKFFLGHAADQLAWLNSFAISLLNQKKDIERVAMRQRMAGWNVDHLAKVTGFAV